jgi:hypothetical protein
MKNPKQTIQRFIACASVLACALPGLARAASPIYDNGPPDHQTASNMGMAWQAEDFTIGAGQSPTSLTFWTLEDHTGADPYRGSISWSILSSPGGSVLGTGTASAATRTLATATTYLGGLNEYRYDFSFGSALGLAAGTYWLVLHNGAFSNLDDPNEFLWETAAANASATGMESFDGGLTWSPTPYQHAFVLSAVPEPASVAMLAGGLLLAGCLRRRERHNPTFAR